jgi:hypothetical protein
LAQKIAAGKADSVLHPAFLVPLTGSAKVALIKIVAPEGDESPILFPDPSFSQNFDSSREVVVAEAVRYPAVMLESFNVTFKKSFLFLVREGHHKGAAGVRKAHHEDLHGLFDPGDDGLGYAPIDLSILAWLKF